MFLRSPMYSAALCCLLAAFPAQPQDSAHPAASPHATAETLIFDGKVPHSGAMMTSDPAMFNFGGQWVQLFTTVGWRLDCASANRYSYTIQQAAAALPAGSDLSSPTSAWQVIPGSAGYSQFISPGPSGAWDHDATEAPKLVSGFDPVKGKNVLRIYYTGWKRVQTSADKSGCPTYGYTDWNMGMAELDPVSNTWIKQTTPLLQDANPWEQLHYSKPDGSHIAYRVVGDQSVIYVPGTAQTAGAWHMYYQATTDVPGLHVVTVHAISKDGVTWPASNRSVLSTHAPYATSLLPGGPYSIDVSVIGGKYYFVGWLPNPGDLSKQGLWVVSSSTPDGSAPGDFTNWNLLLADNNGTWWHSAQPNMLASHQAGLFAPTLMYENQKLWLYYSAVRQDQDGLWTSIGRALVDTAVLR